MTSCEIPYDPPDGDSIVSTSLAYCTLVRLREFVEKRVWHQRRGRVVPTVTTPFCVGVLVKRQQPISVII